jgi:hypothetical protein
MDNVVAAQAALAHLDEALYIRHKKARVAKALEQQ